MDHSADSSYISVIRSLYLSDTTRLFNFIVGVNSPPGMLKSSGHTLNF